MSAIANNPAAELTVPKHSGRDMRPLAEEDGKK
jgi:hypothetical protein